MNTCSHVCLLTFLSPYQNKCKGCGGEMKLSCVCWTSASPTVFNFGCQILVILKLISTRGEFEKYKGICETQWIIALILNFIKEVESIKKKSRNLFSNNRILFSNGIL